MKQLRLHGLGGQGVVTAAKILAHAAGLYENQYAQAMPAYGHERRGAPVYAYLILDAAPILLKSFVYEPDYVLVFDPAVIRQGVNVTAGTHSQTCFLVNCSLSQRERLLEIKAGTLYCVDATGISLRQTGRNVPNAAMLGAFAAVGTVKLEAICAAIRRNWPGEAGEQSVRAAREAYSAVQRLS